MKKYLILIFGLTLFLLSLKGQDKIILYYNSDWEITQKEKAVFYRESEYNLNDFKLNGKVVDYNISDSAVLMEGNYLNNKREGTFVFYYPNGVTESIGEYKSNKRTGTWYYYYKNSNLKQKVYFPENANKYNFTVIDFYDNKGKQMIKNGTGKWINDSIQTFDGLCTITGSFRDSLKNDKWILKRISDNKVMHTENFNKGKLIEATLFIGGKYGTVNSEILNKIPDENQYKLHTTEEFTLDTSVFAKSILNSDVETIFKTVTGKEYKIQNRKAGYLYGDYSMLDFISQNISYPIRARTDGITGIVYVSVTIDSSGKTKEVKLLRGIRSDIDNEAVRVIKLINDWLPEIQNGKPIESEISIPIKFEIIK